MSFSPSAMLAAATPSTDEVQPCRLLDLPGELKNEIYRLVIVTSDKENPIEFTVSGFERSGLFLTCKEIHDDAIKIHLLENCFRHTVRDFRSSALIEFQSLCLKCLTADQYFDELQIDIRIVLHGPPAWINLKDYLHNFYHGKCQHVPRSPGQVEHDSSHPEHKMLRHIIGIIFVTVDMGSRHALPWKDLLEWLDEIRPSLIAINPGWAEDSKKNEPEGMSRIQLFRSQFCLETREPPSNEMAAEQREMDFARDEMSNTRHIEMQYPVI